jgi:hypothetical protein
MVLHNALVTGSLTLNGTDISNITGSSTYSASFASQLTSLNTYTGSNNTNISALHAFSSSILTYTASNDLTNATQSNRLSALEITTGSLNTASGSAITRLNTLETTTGSLNTFSGSAITRLNALETASGSAITRLNSIESNTGSYATTGSNTFVSTQYISCTSNPTGFTTAASLYTDGGLRVTKDAYVSGTLYLNNVTIYGTQSVNYITSSQLDISDNIINVNTATPNVRFGGLAVYDSGSTGLTGSILWDSQNNNWVYSNPSGSGNYDSSMVIMGPRNSGSLGNEQGLNCNYLVQGHGSHHTTSSMIFHDGTNTCIPNTLIGGISCFSTSCATSFIGGTMSGTTIYGSTAVCSPVGKFTTCLDLGGTLTGTSATFSSTIQNVSGIYVRASGNSDLPFINFSNADGVYNWGRVGGCLQGDGDGALYFQTKLGGGLTTKLTINSTGAAIFSSSGLFSGNLQTNGTLVIGNQSCAGTYFLNITPSTTCSVALQGSLAGVGIAAILIQPSGGNVGIGASINPQNLLEVSSTGGSPRIRVGTLQNNDNTARFEAITSNGTTVANSAWLRVNDASGFTLGQSSYTKAGGDSGNFANLSSEVESPAVIVQGNGDVLIGSGTTAEGPLDVYRSASGGLGGHIILRNNGSAVANETAVLFVDGGVGTTRAAISSTTENAPYFGDLKFKTGLGTYACLNTRMTIAGSTGYVGISITSACKNLEVGGTIRTTVSPSVYYRDMSYLGDNYQFGPSETTDNVDFKICGGATFATGGNFRWFTQAGNGTPVERLRITSAGFTKMSNTGGYVCTTNTNHEIRSNQGGWNVLDISHFATSNPYGFSVNFSGASPNNSSNWFAYMQDSTAQRFSIHSNGGIANFQANDVNLSDERTKKDIIALESYWDKFKAIEIVKFKYKDQTHDDFNIGVIAQQVEEVAPEFVDVDGWDETPVDGVPLKSVYTADLHHTTIKVLQEAMSKIETQQCTINTLKTCLGII